MHESTCLVRAKVSEKGKIVSVWCVLNTLRKSFSFSFRANYPEKGMNPHISFLLNPPAKGINPYFQFVRNPLISLYTIPFSVISAKHLVTGMPRRLMNDTLSEEALVLHTLPWSFYLLWQLQIYVLSSSNLARINSTRLENKIFVCFVNIKFISFSSIWKRFEIPKVKLYTQISPEYFLIFVIFIAKFISLYFPILLCCIYLDNQKEPSI